MTKVSTVVTLSVYEHGGHRCDGTPILRLDRISVKEKLSVVEGLLNKFVQANPTVVTGHKLVLSLEGK